MDKNIDVTESITVSAAHIGLVRIAQDFRVGHPKVVYIERRHLDALVSALLSFKPVFLDYGAGI